MRVVNSNRFVQCIMLFFIFSERFCHLRIREELRSVKWVSYSIIYVVVSDVCFFSCG